ncbi:DUF3244 domain-containing protein [Bacteroides neonati]|uniref:DUF3244 domain-containing protein n=1 Tax=Bacteroides neonati TaxID=1347393 RepID=UPI0016525D37|nr:DUF3244 domain-containing protein [Bacteroides neonati]
MKMSLIVFIFFILFLSELQAFEPIMENEIPIKGKQEGVEAGSIARDAANVMFSASLFSNTLVIDFDVIIESTIVRVIDMSNGKLIYSDFYVNVKSLSFPINQIGDFRIEVQTNGGDFEGFFPILYI